MFIYNKFLIAGCSMLLISACSPRITKEVTSVKAPGEKTEETTIDIAALPAAEIPLGGNAFITSEDRSVQANNTSISNWKNTESVVSVYFKALQAGTYYLSLKAKTADSSRISVKIAEKKEELKMPISSTFEETAKLQFKVNKPGYVRVDLQAISKTTEIFTQISYLVIRGENAKTLAYVKNNEKHRFHFGRRGPSVHLNFIVPDSSKEKVEYFYNEIRVPKGQDVIGSYFQADGFSYGYFGMQVNSATERRILFSVWSPFQTDNPNEIPEEDKIILIKKGASVYTGEFGNEGSGGQSYMRLTGNPKQTMPSC